MPDDAPPVGRRLTWRLGLAASVLVVLVYHLMFINRFFPIQEGWFSAYAHLILDGKVPYRDFYLFLQPVYPLLITALVRVAGYGFLAVRVLGLGERLLLTALLYVLLARLFRPVTAFVACLTAIVVYASNTTDVIDSYLQVCLILALLGVYLVIRGLEAKTPLRASWWVFGAGVAEALAFFTKQTTGLLVAASTVLVAAVVLSSVRRDRVLHVALGYVVGWAVPSMAIAAWLAWSGAIGAYLQQAYGSAASSKGSLDAILSGVLQRSLTLVDAVTFGLLCLVGVAWVLAARWCADAPAARERHARLRASLLGATAAGVSVWWWVLEERHRWLVGGLVVIGVAAQIAALYLETRHPSASRRLQQWLVGPVALVAVAGVAALLLRSPQVYALWLWWRLVTLHFLDMKQLFISWSLFACVGLTAYWLVRLIRGRDTERALVFSLCGAAAVAVIYAHSMSYVVEAHAAVPALGVAVGALLEWRLSGRVFRVAVVGGIIAVTLVLCADQRYVWPYQWWGWREPAISHSTVVPREPLLWGFIISPVSDTVYEKVDHIIEARVSSGDWIYCFPDVPLFYVTTGFYPRTNALVAYWDVCPDDVAEADAAVPLADPPAVIVDLHLPEDVWRFHETAFRGGRRSGQRAIASAIDSLTSSGRYTLTLDAPAANGASLLVWVRNDGT